MFKSIGTNELIIIGIVVLLFFGSKKIPELFRGLGDAVKEFKKAAKDGSDHDVEAKKDKS